jgi:hypothetical protein
VLAAQSQPAASTPKKPAPQTVDKSTAKSAPAKQTTAKSTTTKKTTAAKTVTPPVRRYTQQQPTTDRYKDIQQALTDRGYFKGPVDGQWGPESVDALKQFQREQKIDEDGKISSLSLIALGLGPHRNIAPTQSARSTNPTPRPSAAPPPGQTEAAQTEAAGSANATAGP